MTRRIVLMVLALASAGAARAQIGTIVGVIVSRETGLTMAYSVVALPAFNRERFTSERGAFLFSGIPAGPTRLRVRRIGYLTTDTVINVRADVIDTVRVEMQRVAVQLSTVDVRGFPPCTRPGAPNVENDPTLATMFEQLMLNAQQFELLSKSYPFSYLLVATLAHVDKDGVRYQDDIDSVRITSTETWKYRPGALVGFSSTGRRFGDRVFRVPTLLNFADPDFVKSHCFHNGGLMD